MAHQTISSSILVAASGYTYAPTSSINLGDQAQLTRTVERLRAAFPGSRLVAVANSLKDRGNLDGLEVSYSTIRYLTSPVVIPIIGIRLLPEGARVIRVLLLLTNARRVAGKRTTICLSADGRAALREMEESSGLFISGAGVFNDLYTLGVGAFWGVLVRCMSLLKKPIVASGQQIGPFRRLSRRAVARWALHPFDLIGVRDPLSIASASALDVPPQRIVLTGDDAWELAPEKSALAHGILTRIGVPEHFIAVQIRFGPSVGWDEADSRSLAVSLDQLCLELGLPVVFVPLMTSLDADDRYAAGCVKGKLVVPSWAIEEPLDARATKAILGRATLGVGTANHFCVFAASMGTPVIGLYSSPYMKQKITGLAKLWPSRVAASPKETGLRPTVLVATARQLLASQTDSRIEREDRPSMQTQPDEPVRFLARALEPLGRPYKTRFADGPSAEAYERDLGPRRFLGKVSDLERNTLRSAIALAGRTRFERHLDFACGTGRSMSFVQGLADSSVGVDVSAAMLELARRRLPAAQFICGDVSTDPHLLEGLGPFDLVTVWRFIAPAEPELRIEALTALARSMDDRGLLLVNNNANRTSLHGVALFLRSLVRRQRLRDSGPYRGSLPHRQLCRLLQTVGFHVEETRGICYLPEQVTRRLPPWLWMPLERALGRLNIVPRYAVNQLLIAQRSERADEPSPRGA